MAACNSRYRLRSSALERKDENEEEKIDPKRIIILSVEGDETERSYFESLNDHLNGSLCRIEVLRHRRGDGYSDPEHVIELLNEYISVREGELIPADLPEEFTNKYSQDIVQKYLDNSDELSSEDKKKIKEDLVLIGIDLEYRKYLQSFHHDTDFFGVVLDRDHGNHTRQLMERCKDMCDKKEYGYYISNPCFEFWLLLHWCNPVEKYTPEILQAILDNKKVSNRKTKVGEILGEYIPHGKRINKKVFDEYYYPRIDQALNNATNFADTFPDIYDKLGTNLPDLLNKLGFIQK